MLEKSPFLICAFIKKSNFYTSWKLITINIVAYEF
jgi:hypothetical protein